MGGLERGDPRNGRAVWSRCRVMMAGEANNESNVAAKKEVVPG